MILDILLAVFLLLLMVGGWRIGFIRSFFGLVGFLASLILTKLLYLPFTGLLYGTPLYQKISDALSDTLALEVPDLIPPAFAEALGITDALASASVNLLGILSYIILFVLIYIALSILVRVLDRVFRLPILNFANRVLGLLLNGLKGILLCYLCGVILQFFRADIVAESVILTNILATVPGLAELLF